MLGLPADDVDVSKHVAVLKIYKIFLIYNVVHLLVWIINFLFSSLVLLFVLIICLFRNEKWLFSYL